MKVIIASTIEQKKRIGELILQLREQVLPRFCSETDYECWEKLGVLEFPSEPLSKYDAMNDAFRVIVSLETIISILESEYYPTYPGEYLTLFERNVNILHRYHIPFPFNLQYFIDKYALNNKSANEFLI